MHSNILYTTFQKFTEEDARRQSFSQGREGYLIILYDHDSISATQLYHSSHKKEEEEEKEFRQKERRKKAKREEKVKGREKD